VSIVNGVGRGVVGWTSDQIGRKQTLLIVLVIEARRAVRAALVGNAHNEILFMVFALSPDSAAAPSYPMFAALTPDYFGENNNATNYGLIYSAKLVSGLFGLGLASYVVEAYGYDGAFTIAGVIAFVSALIAAFLRQPGRRDAEPVAAPSAPPRSRCRRPAGRPERSPEDGRCTRRAARVHRPLTPPAPQRGQGVVG
jgi:MFS family permease